MPGEKCLGWDAYVERLRAGEPFFTGTSAAPAEAKIIWDSAVQVWLEVKSAG
jgi:hypothetical protein